MPITQVTQGLLIYDDFAGYSNDSLTDLATANWSVGTSGDGVGDNVLKYSVESGVARTDEVSNGEAIYPVNLESADSRTEMVVAAEISLEGNHGDTRVGLMANGWADDPNDSFIWAEIYRNVLSGQTRLNVGLKLSGSVVFQQHQSIGTYTNPYKTLGYITSWTT